VGGAALVSFTSASVLVLEILAGRMLAPFVGVTLETFTGIIGTVLAGIAVGSWLGGRSADRTDPQRLLPALLLVGGVLVVVTPTVVTFVGPSLSGDSPMQIAGLAFIGFFAPAAVLSAVSPTVAKIELRSLDDTGTLVGGLSAIGTAGAIFGTLSASGDSRSERCVRRPKRCRHSRVARSPPVAIVGEARGNPDSRGLPSRADAEPGTSRGLERRRSIAIGEDE
jgi:hypothetical protein